MVIKVLLCEDQTLVRQYLAELLGLDEGLAVVGEAADGSEAIRRVAEMQPDVVLMDIEMPVMDGIEAARVITRDHPSTCVIMLTTHGSERYVLECLRSGAAGFVLKESDGPELPEIIRRVLAGERYIEPSLASEAIFELARAIPARPPTPEA